MGRALVRVAVVAAVAILAPGARSADAPDAGVQQETRVSGTVPDLTGRWLLVATLGHGGVNRATTSAWDVAHDEGGLRIRERIVALPAADRARLDRGDWTPTPADLDAIASGWDALTPVERGIARVRHEILGPDAFDDSVRRDRLAEGALWIVRQGYAFLPGGSRPTQEHRVFAATAREGDGWAGRYADATIAMAPLPLPITLEGTFRLIRVPSPTRSLWARLADVFRGCN